MLAFVSSIEEGKPMFLFRYSEKDEIRDGKPCRGFCYLLAKLSLQQLLQPIRLFCTVRSCKRDTEHCIRLVHPDLAPIENDFRDLFW